VIVVDTNILAYLLIEGDRTQQAQALFARDAEWKSDAFILTEFTNILATYVRSRGVTLKQAESLLGHAEASLRGLVNVPHTRALRVSERYSVAAYDARFLAAAESLGGKLVTEDAKLRTAAPKLTQSLSEALSD
jgi:predicted nucleic acid-binding protein